MIRKFKVIMNDLNIIVMKVQNIGYIVYRENAADKSRDLISEMFDDKELQIRARLLKIIGILRLDRLYLHKDGLWRVNYLLEDVPAKYDDTKSVIEILTPAVRELSNQLGCTVSLNIILDGEHALTVEESDEIGYGVNEGMTDITRLETYKGTVNLD